MGQQIPSTWNGSSDYCSNIVRHKANRCKLPNPLAGVAFQHRHLRCICPNRWRCGLMSAPQHRSQAHASTLTHRLLRDLWLCPLFAARHDRPNRAANSKRTTNHRKQPRSSGAMAFAAGPSPAASQARLPAHAQSPTPLRAQLRGAIQSCLRLDSDEPHPRLAAIQKFDPHLLKRCLYARARLWTRPMLIALPTLDRLRAYSAPSGQIRNCPVE